MKARYLLGGILLAGAIYFALFGGEYSLLELGRIKRERAAEADRLSAARADVQQLEARVDSLASDPATIERIARERWGLIRPGERLYRFDESLPDSTARDSARDSATTRTGGGRGG